MLRIIVRNDCYFKDAIRQESSTRTSCSVSRDGCSPFAEDWTSAVAESPLTRIVPIVSCG
jgi:hypothetical protein